MADDNGRKSLSRDEARLLFRLRLISGGVVLVCLVLLVIADIFSQLLNLHVSELLFGTLVGALLVLVGLSAPNLNLTGGPKQ